MSRKDIHAKLATLAEYADLDGTEWGEMIHALETMHTYSDYISEEMYNALKAEIESNYQWALDNCKIVEEVETYTRTVRRLEHEE